MKSSDEIIRRCLSTAGLSDPAYLVADDCSTYTAIELDKNEGLKSHLDRFEGERSEVDEVVRSILQEEDDDSAEKGVCVVQTLREARDGSYVDQTYVAMNTPAELTLHTSAPYQVPADDLRRHYFYIQESPKKRLTSLAVMVVYTGSFDGRTYHPGELSVELRRISNTSDRPIPLGRSPDELQVPNTESQIGRAFVQYQPVDGVIEGGVYELAVFSGEQSLGTQYSITVGGSIACSLAEAAKNGLAALVHKRKEIATCTEEAIDLEKNLILLRRKKFIEEKLIRQTRAKNGEREAQLEAHDRKMDFQDEMSEEAVSSIVSQINSLQLEFDAGNALLATR